MNFLLLSILLLFIGGCQLTMNDSIHDRKARVQDFIEKQLQAKNFPGIQYLLLNSNSLLFEFAGGWADVSGKRPMQTGTTIMMYSMTKVITAAAVLQLVEGVKISLDDPHIKYFPTSPYDRKITIRHLLSQTSGIPNPIPLKWVHLAVEHDSFREDSALREVLRKNPKVNFTPGKKYTYSNISYWLLGKIIEEVTRKDYASYVREHIFKRLSLPSNEADFVIPSLDNHSKGYIPKWSFLNFFKSFMVDAKFFGDYEDGWLHVKEHYLNGPAFGGMVGSAHSLAIFLQDLLRDQPLLFPPETRNLFFEQQKNNKGQPIQMTLGWHIGMMGDFRYLFKEGGGAGFHGEMRIYPEKNCASVTVANNTSFNVKKFLNTADQQFWQND
ncbi:MAG: serine hydrolase [Caldithrix sp. RBG_13_44_9]|nr:MAG: serine hydrolase [Caldithrix sp. RBG_13_44_9]